MCRKPALLCGRQECLPHLLHFENQPICRSLFFTGREQGRSLTCHRLPPSAGKRIFQRQTRRSLWYILKPALTRGAFADVLPETLEEAEQLAACIEAPCSGKPAVASPI